MILEILLALAALVWCLSSYLVWYTQDRAIFVGDGAAFGEHPELARMGGLAMRTERDGQALRWYWIEAKEAKAVLILFHGNAGGALERLDFAAALKPMGVSVALVEFPGYAGDPGPTREWAILRNSLAAYDEIDSRRHGLPFFVMGESLGTGPATFSAYLRAPRALILSTPYTSMADVAKYRYPWVPIHSLIRHPIKSKLWAPQVQCPVLILHGTKDKTVPYALGRAQALNFRTLESFVTVEGAGHNDIRSAHEGQFWTACGEFIAKHCQDLTG